MKAHHETTFGSVFQPWPLKSLTEVAFFQEGPGLRKWQWTESGMKVINVTNILGDGSVDVNNTARFISLEEYESKYRHFAVDAGDIVVASSGNTYGKVGRVNHSHLPIMMNTSVIRFHSADPEKLDQNFLYAFLRSHLFKNQMESFVIGSAQPNFGPSHLKRMVIPCPDIATQRKIAGILSAYDDLIENNTRRIAILEQMAQSIYREWFVNFRFPGHQNVKLVDTPLGKIPEGWRATTLGEVVSNFDRLRKPLSSMQRADMKGEYPYYGAAKIFDYINNYIFDGKYLLVAEDGSVITPDRKPVLQMAYGKFWVNNHTHILQGKLPVCTEHLCLSLSFTDVSGYVTGAAQPKITQANMNRMPFLVATDDVQAAFTELVVPLFDEMHLLNRKSANLRSTRDLLLPKLITGQLNVEELDIDAGEPLAEVEAK